MATTVRTRITSIRSNCVTRTGQASELDYGGNTERLRSNETYKFDNDIVGMLKTANKNISLTKDKLSRTPFQNI